MPFVQTCTERESTARLGSTKGKLCKFGSGAYGLSVDPNAIRLPEDCTSSRRTSAAPITDIFGSTFATIRLVWCLLLLKTGIAVPSTRTIAEEPIQEFHFISENLVCTDFRAGGSNLERHNFPADEAIRDYLYHENDKDFGSELPGKLKRKFFRASGIFTIAAALFSPVFFDLYEIHAFAVEALFSFDYQDLSVDEYHLSGTMASSANPAPGGGIPLHEFRREVPPGWGPGIPDYPLRLFFERLKLWYQVYDGEDTMVGPLVAGRLQGKAQRLGLTLRLPRPDGGVDIGGDALARLTVDEVRDPNDPTVILQRHIPSGIQALCNALKDAFGVSDQELVSRSIEDFFEYRRGKLSFQEYSIERDCKLEEASTRAGLQINDVAKFYLFFRGSGLPAKFIEDIKLQLQGDLRLFREARALALRLISRKDDIGAGNDSYYEDYGYDDPDELHAWYADDWDWEAAEWDQPWDASAWYEEGWSWVPDYDSYLSEPDDESSWPPEGTSDEANQDPEAEHPAYHGEVPSPSHSSDQAAESYPMHKGKGIIRHLAPWLKAKEERALLGPKEKALASPSPAMATVVATARRARVAARRVPEKANGLKRAKARAIGRAEVMALAAISATRRPCTRALTRRSPLRLLLAERYTSSWTATMTSPFFLLLGPGKAAMRMDRKRLVRVRRFLPCQKRSWLSTLPVPFSVRRRTTQYWVRKDEACWWIPARRLGWLALRP